MEAEKMHDVSAWRILQPKLTIIILFFFLLLLPTCGSKTRFSTYFPLVFLPLVHLKPWREFSEIKIDKFIKKNHELTVKRQFPMSLWIIDGKTNMNDTEIITCHFSSRFNFRANLRPLINFCNGLQKKRKRKTTTVPLHISLMASSSNIILYRNGSSFQWFINRTLIFI